MHPRARVPDASRGTFYSICLCSSAPNCWLLASASYNKKQGERTLVPLDGLEKGHEHHPQDPRTLIPRAQALSLSASPAPGRRATPSTTSTPQAAAAQAAAGGTDRSRGAGTPGPARGTVRHLLRPPAGLQCPLGGGGTFTRTLAPPGPPLPTEQFKHSAPRTARTRGHREQLVARLSSRGHQHALPGFRGGDEEAWGRGPAKPSSGARGSLKPGGKEAVAAGGRQAGEPWLRGARRGLRP